MSGLVFEQYSRHKWTFLFVKITYNSTEIPRHFIWDIINLDVDNDDIEDDSSANIHFYLKDVIIH